MLYALIAAFFIALLSLSGVLISSTRGHISGMHRFWIPLSVGVFLGVVFFELIPETIFAGGETGGLVIAAGFLGFFFLSFLLRRDHACEGAADCSNTRHTPHALLIGDSLHNIADGVLLFSAFVLSPQLGVVTALAIALHEIPQEIAEYSVLRKAGYSHGKALRYNFITALSIIVGVTLAALFIHIGDVLWVLTGITAGNLLYIIASDLLPELQDERHQEHFGSVMISLLAGFLLIVITITFSHSTLENAGAPHAHELEVDTHEEHAH